jgi:signal transduction histidine kinase
MSQSTGSHVGPLARRPVTSVGAVQDAASRAAAPWEYVVLAVGIAAAAVALWVTARAGFLAHPSWLAVQKADFILGPIGVGLYWHHMRPGNRLGLLLIALGLLAIPYIGQSTSSPWTYTLAGGFENLLEALMFAVILAFPNGRLGRVEWAILAVYLVGEMLASLVTYPVLAQWIPYFSISGCRTSCPASPFFSHSLYASFASWLTPLSDVNRVTIVATFLATVGLFAWRFFTGTPPRRRALAIGAPIAVCFLVASAAYQIISLAQPQYIGVLGEEPPTTWLQWVVAASRSAVWYGFLFALIAAELYAGRVLRRLNRDSLGRPTFGQLEGLLRRPLGDPGLRLGFWQAESHEWADADGGPLAPPGAGQDTTEIDRDEHAVIEIVHDEQLSEDPELLQAAGAVALMALENAELDAAWKQALHDLRDSRARLANASDDERRRLAQDLHDGAQQRLVAIQISLQLLKDDDTKADLDKRLEAIREETGDAIEDLRTLAHGMYPALLRDRGLADALRAVATRAPVPITVTDRAIGRCSPAVEAALYFCSLEAVQNALKHAGNDTHVTVVVGRNHDQAHFTVADDGAGMTTADTSDGMGLVVMRDRMGAVSGTLEVTSSPGAGTTVHGTAPADGLSPALPPAVDRAHGWERILG